MAILQFKGGEPKGVIIGSGWKNSKGGYGISLRGQVRVKGELVAVKAYKIVYELEDGNEMVIPFKTSVYEGRNQGGKLLLAPSTRQVEGKRSPDMILFAYPQYDK